MLRFGYIRKTSITDGVEGVGRSEAADGSQKCRTTFQRLASRIDTFQEGPASLMVVTATEAAYTSLDGVHMVPLACLAP